jgi:hypothetical protein
MRDPFVEAGCPGYSLRGVAHLQADGAFTPSLTICDNRHGDGGILYECLFEELFSDADAAINRAMDEGRKKINDLLEANWRSARDAGR